MGSSGRDAAGDAPRAFYARTASRGGCIQGATWCLLPAVVPDGDPRPGVGVQPVPPGFPWRQRGGFHRYPLLSL